MLSPVTPTSRQEKKQKTDARGVCVRVRQVRQVSPSMRLTLAVTCHALTFKDERGQQERVLICVRAVATPINNTTYEVAADKLFC
jgi:hypothetical protein